MAEKKQKRKRVIPRSQWPVRQTMPLTARQKYQEAREAFLNEKLPGRESIPKVKDFLSGLLWGGDIENRPEPGSARDLGEWGNALTDVIPGKAAVSTGVGMAALPFSKLIKKVTRREVSDIDDYPHYLYHGTRTPINFEHFDPNKNTGDWFKEGIHFGENPEQAVSVAMEKPSIRGDSDDHLRIIPAELDAQRVLDVVEPWKSFTLHEDAARLWPMLSDYRKGQVREAAKLIHRGKPGEPETTGFHIHGDTDNPAAEGWWEIKDVLATTATGYRLDDVLNDTGFDAIRYLDIGEPAWAVNDPGLIKSPWGLPLGKSSDKYTKKPVKFLAPESGPAEIYNPFMPNQLEELNKPDPLNIPSNPDYQFEGKKFWPETNPDVWSNSSEDELASKYWGMYKGQDDEKAKFLVGFEQQPIASQDKGLRFYKNPNHPDFAQEFETEKLKAYGDEIGGIFADKFKTPEPEIRHKEWPYGRLFVSDSVPTSELANDPYFFSLPSRLTGKHKVIAGTKVPPVISKTEQYRGWKNPWYKGNK